MTLCERCGNYPNICGCAEADALAARLESDADLIARLRLQVDDVTARYIQAAGQRDTSWARLAEADWLLSLTWELETNQYKYPVDEYGDRLQAYIDAMNAASASVTNEATK